MSSDSDVKRQIHRQAVNLGIARDSDPWTLVINHVSLHFAVWHNWDLARVSRMPLQNVLEYLHAEDPTTEVTTPNQNVHFSSDFSVVVWQGQQYFFNRTQARVVELLYSESQKGTVGLHQDTIGNRLQSCNSRFRLFHVFRNKNGKMHPLWNVLVVRVEPGIYSLRLEFDDTPVAEEGGSAVESTTQAGSDRIPEMKRPVMNEPTRPAGISGIESIIKQ